MLNSSPPNIPRRFPRSTAGGTTHSCPRMYFWRLSPWPLHWWQTTFYRVPPAPLLLPWLSRVVSQSRRKGSGGSASSGGRISHWPSKCVPGRLPLCAADPPPPLRCVLHTGYAASYCPVIARTLSEGTGIETRTPNPPCRRCRGRRYPHGGRILARRISCPAMLSQLPSRRNRPSRRH
jgi:hypothetical protein